MHIGQIHLNLREGTIEGDFQPGQPVGVVLSALAGAMEAIKQSVRDGDFPRPDYVNYDEGKVFMD